MPGPTPDQILLIKRFEPILYCAPGERFFPSDAKRYVERCSLWRADDPTGQFATAPTWGAAPAIPEANIVATQSEAGVDDVYLGMQNPNGSGFEYLSSSPGHESFLSLFDWRPTDTGLPNPTRYANIEAIATEYSLGALNNSQFRYHAEFFDTDRLTGLFGGVVASGGHDFADLLKPHETVLPVLRNPSLICYYLFFPAHEEGLPDCDNPDAQHFGDYAGDWACVAVLLDQATPTTDPELSKPMFIGLTNRNIGLVKQPDGSEVRVGMRIKPWASVETPDSPDHASLSVAKGTHAIYLRGDAQGDVAPFTADDLARSSCGVAEQIRAGLSFLDGGPGPPFGKAGLLVAKTLAGAALGTKLFPWSGGIAAGLGALAGAIWGVAEAAENGEPIASSPGAPAAPSPVVDTLASAGDAGKVIHPADLLPAGVAAANAVPWPSAAVTMNGRSYDIYVDRGATVLWPDDPQNAGYGGRWGPRVENDAFLRRSGMLFPNFWRMFFDALMLTNPPSAAPVQFPIAQTEGTPIGNATTNPNAGLAAAYDGNDGKTWAESPTGDSPAGVYIGKSYPTPYRFSGIEIWLSSDLGFNGNDGAQRTCTVYGKTGADPANPRDGDQLFTFQVTDTAGLHLSNLAGFEMTATHDRVWVTLDNQIDGVSVFTQVVWYATV
jgi:hypothetical protein